MDVSATVKSSRNAHEACVGTAGNSQSIAIPGKPSGQGSAVNGGELMLLPLATCYCNDLYREAARLGIPLDGVEVTATATFPGIGLAATDIRYEVGISSPAPPAAIADLVRQTDAVVEVHNTIRTGVPVLLDHHRIRSASAKRINQ